MAMPIPQPKPTPPPTTPAAKRKLRTEAIAGGTRSQYDMYARTLPIQVDDLTAQLGDDIYDRMRHDAKVAGNLMAIKTAITAHGWQIEPAVLGDKAKKRDLKRADEIATTITAMLGTLEQPFASVLDDQLDGIWYGNRCAELVFEQATINKKTWLGLKAIKPKPRRNIAFVVDPYMNHLGFLARMPGYPFPVTSGMLPLGIGGEMPKNFVPRYKVWSYSHGVRDGDPRGHSFGRAVYQPWWTKMQLYPEFMQYLAQFAGPSIWATLPPDTDAGSGMFDPVDESSETTTPEQKLLVQLQKFRSSSAIAFSNGYNLNVIEANPEGGRAFLSFFEWCDAQITIAMMGQLLTTGTTDHQTNASTKTQKTVFDDVISAIKGGFAGSFKRDVLRTIVLLNWGASALHLTPSLNLGEVEEADITPLMNAVAQLQRSGYLDQSQYPPIDVMLGLPPRSMESMHEEAEAKTEAEQTGQPPAEQPEDETEDMDEADTADQPREEPTDE